MNVEIMQYVRGKGQLIPVTSENGLVQFDSNGKPKMRREKGAPRGVLIATKKNGRFYFGWSLAHTKDDCFNKQHGIDIAKARAIPIISVVENDLPHDVKKIYTQSFKDRIINYSHDSRELSNAPYGGNDLYKKS